MFKRLLSDDHGQDLIEYALLTTAIGLAGIVTWPLIVDAMGAAYAALDTQTQNIWEVPPPGAGM
jgi:Flp pilus assembly pilin Flp